jgi:hypothetical protein
MSDHDEPPTEPSAALTSTRPVEPEREPVATEAEGEPEAPAPSGVRAAFGALSSRRVLAVLLAVGLLWLGVWAYTSGSSSSSSGAVGSVATIPNPPTTVARARKPKRNQKPNAPTATTMPTPPANLTRTAPAYATALFGYWQSGDQADALRVADARVVRQLFRRPPRGRDQWVAQGCDPAGRVTNCSWVSTNHQLLLEVQNPTASTAPLVVALAVLR